MTKLLLLSLIFLIRLISCSSFLNYIIPFYNFTLHDTPLVYNNDTTMENEISFYNDMKKSTILHVAASTVTSVVVVTTMWSVAPIPITYWAYHVYVFQKSSHIKQKCEYLVNDNNNDDKRYNRGWTPNIPSFFFNPLFFCTVSLIGLILIIVYNKLSITNIILLGLGFVYMYSFFQEVKISIDKIKIEKDLKLRELLWTCNILRVSYWGRIKKALTLSSIQTDDDGYYVNNKECQLLEVEYDTINESFIEILYRTFTKSIISIFRELFYSFSSISLIDKILIVIGLIFFYKILSITKSFFTKKESGLELEREEKKEKKVCKEEREVEGEEGEIWKEGEEINICNL